jgi:hypothetical protein
MDEMIYMSREPIYVNDAGNEYVEREDNAPIQLWYMVPHLKALDVIPEQDDFSASVLHGLATEYGDFSYEGIFHPPESIVLPTLTMMRARNFEGAYMHALYFACNAVVTLSDRHHHGMELESRDTMALRGITSMLMHFIEDRDPSVIVPLERGFGPMFSTSALSVLISSSGPEMKAQLEDELAPFSFAILDFLRGLHRDKLRRKHVELVILGGTCSVTVMCTSRTWRQQVCSAYVIGGVDVSIGKRNADTDRSAYDAAVKRFVLAICNA